MDRTQYSDVIANLEERLAALRLLALELIECRPAFRRLDVNAMERHTGHQQRLCARIAALNQKLGKHVNGTQQDQTFHDSEDGRAEFSGGEHHSELLRQTRTIAQEVQRLNEIHRGFLAGSRRTLSAIANLFASYQPVYGMPTFARSVTFMQGPGN